MKHDIANFIALIIVLVVQQLLTKGSEVVKKKFLKPWKLLRSVSINKQINALLFEARVYVKANSVHILGYHNGTEGYDGGSFDYISMLYEDTDEWTAKMIDKYQSIPASQYADLMDKLNQSESLVYIDCEEKSNIGRLHKGYGVFSSYKIKIGKNISGGSISISYYNHRHEMTDDETEFILRTRIKIKALLDKKKK